MIPPDANRRLLYVLHLALCELRSLPAPIPEAQIRELADVLEFIPRCVMLGPDAETWTIVRSNLRDYRVHYPDHVVDYVDVLDRGVPLGAGW